MLAAEGVGPANQAMHVRSSECPVLFRSECRSKYLVHAFAFIKICRLVWSFSIRRTWVAQPDGGADSFALTTESVRREQRFTLHKVVQATRDVNPLTRPDVAFWRFERALISSGGPRKTALFTCAFSSPCSILGTPDTLRRSPSLLQRIPVPCTCGQVDADKDR